MKSLLFCCLFTMLANAAPKFKDYYCTDDLLTKAKICLSKDENGKKENLYIKFDNEYIEVEKIEPKLPFVKLSFGGRHKNVGQFEINFSNEVVFLDGFINTPNAADKPYFSTKASLQYEFYTLVHVLKQVQKKRLDGSVVTESKWVKSEIVDLGKENRIFYPE